jgi:hypothetical protein
MVWQPRRISPKAALSALFFIRALVFLEITLDVHI